MATKYAAPLDVCALSSAPSSPVAGQVYYDTTAGAFGCYSGSAWQYLQAPDATAGDIQPAGQSASAGSKGLAADAKHIHPPGSAFLCTPSIFAPSSQASLTVSTTTMAPFVNATTVAAGSNTGTISAIGSWSSPSAGVLDASTAGFPSSGTLNVAASGPTTAVVTYTGTTGTSFTGCAYVSGSPSGTVATGGAITLTTSGSAVTGSFTAPASGSVLVTVSFAGAASATGTFMSFGLAAHGTLTPIVANEAVSRQTTGVIPFIIPFLVTGLTAGTSYNFDLLGCCLSADVFTISALGTVSTTPTLNTNSTGQPLMMTVQAI